MTQKSGINGDEMMTLEHQDLTERIIGAATLVHRRLGPGCEDHTRSQASDRLLKSTTFLVSCLPHCVVPLHNSGSAGDKRDEALRKRAWTKKRMRKARRQEGEGDRMRDPVRESSLISTTISSDLT